MRKTVATLLAGFAIALSGTAAHAQISDDAVKIGVLTDMSSLYSDATGKGSLAAVQMAVADFGGKVKGKPIVVLSGDHQNKPDVGVNIARNWIDNDKLDAVFEALPGSNFTVYGAPIPHDSALTSAGAQMFFAPNWSLLVKFDGEFASASQTDPGSGTLRYTW